MYQSDFDDDYLEGIAADAFDPRPEPFTLGEMVICLAVLGMAIVFMGYVAVPLMKSAATAALLFASAR